MQRARGNECVRVCEFEDKRKDLNRAEQQIGVFKWTETPKGDHGLKKKKAKHSYRI